MRFNKKGYTASQTPVMWVVAIAAIILLGVGLWSSAGVKTAIEAGNANVPTAEDIASAIVIPSVPTAAEIGAEIAVPRNANANLDNLLEGVFPDEVRDLERECIRDLQDEFDDGDVLDDIEDLIEAHEGEEIDNLEILDFNFEDDYDFDVINLGLDDDDDKEAEITSTLRVVYNLEDGDQEDLKDKVYTLATCEDYDGEDDEFDDVDVVYSLSDIYA